MAASTRTKINIIPAIILLSSTITLSAGLDVRRVPNPSPTPETTECTTKTCFEAASRISSWMNDSVDPCDNFYEFVCGGWIESHKLGKGRGAIQSVHKDTMYHELRRETNMLLNSTTVTDDPRVNRIISKMRKFYQRCLYGVPKKPIHLHLQEIYDRIPLPYLNTTGWNHYEKRFEDLAADVANIGVHFLVHLYVGKDSRNQSRRMLHITPQNNWAMEERFFSSGRNRAALKESMENILTKVYDDLNITASVDSEKLLQIQDDLINATKPPHRLSRNNSRRLAVSELKDTMTNFNLKKYLDQRLKIANIRLNDNDTVQITNYYYLKELDKILSKWPKETLGQLVTLLLTKEIILFLPKDYQESCGPFRHCRGRRHHYLENWLQCFYTVLEYFEYTITRLFREEYFNKTVEKEASEMVNNVINAFYRLLKTNAWLNDETKEIVSKKVKKMRIFLGYEERYINANYLEEHYGKIAVTDSFISDRFENYLVASREHLETLEKPKKREKRKSSVHPLLLHILYLKSMNSLSIPMTRLDKPLFDINYPKYLNYGGLGVAIGYAITRGFDTKGHYYNEDGKKRKNGTSWWPRSVLQRFVKATECMQQQYKNYTSSIDKRRIPRFRRYTLDFDIADNAGVKQSFEAYQELIRKRGKPEPKLPLLPLTPNQLFFITFGQKYCANLNRFYARYSTSPPEFRVLGSLSNLPSFHEAFKCKKGTRMNPEEQCTVW